MYNERGTAVTRFTPTSPYRPFCAFVILETVARLLRNATRVIRKSGSGVRHSRHGLCIRSHARVYTCPAKIGLSAAAWLVKRANERTKERTNERAKERTNERANERRVWT